MVEAKFTSEMLEVLKDLKGKTFKSYECNKIGDNCCNQYCRINLGTYSIELTNYESELPFFDSTEDIPVFECLKVDKDSAPNISDKCDRPHVYMVDEVIKNVSIINDVINVNDGEYIISIDQALVLETRNNIRSFYKDWMFSENINFYTDRKESHAYEIDKVKYDWSDRNKDKVTINRTQIVL